MSFYSYLWLRKNDTPYYAGKGSARRAFISHVGHRPPRDKSRIVIFPMLNEAEAFESEMALIELFGRKDNGTGILRNLTDGGEGVTGQVLSLETRAKISATLTGRKNGPHSEETKRKISVSAKAQWANTNLREFVMKSNIGRAVSPKTRKKIGNAARGNTHRRGQKASETTKALLSASHKGLPWSVARRAAHEAKWGA